MEVIDLDQPVNSAWGLGNAKVEEDEVNDNTEPVETSPKKSPTKEQKKTVSDAIGNDEIQEWMVHIVDAFNRESMIRYERGEISDKNPIIVKSTRDLEDGFVIGLAIRAHCPNLIAPHNITRSSNRKQKLSNWVFLNERVFNKLGFKIEDQLITDVVDHDKQRLIDFILMLKNLLERHHPQKPVDPSSSNMMLRPLEKIYQIPALLNSKRSKRKVSQLKAFHLLEPADQSILLEKEKVLTRHRVCINELESRFRAVQGDIKEKKATIARIERGDPEGTGVLHNSTKCLLSAFCRLLVLGLLEQTMADSWARTSVSLLKVAQSFHEYDELEIDPGSVDSIFLAPLIETPVEIDEDGEKQENKKKGCCCTIS